MNNYFKLIKTMIQNQYDKVKEFNNILGKSYKFYSEAQPQIFISNPEVLKSRILLLEEEINELINAHENNNLVEYIDALCDILYVIYSFGLVFSIQFDLDIKEYTPKKKDDNFYKNILKNKEIFDLTCEDYKYKDSIQVCFLSLRLACEHQIFDFFEESLYNFIKTIYKISELLEINLNDFFDEVHKSNMTKKCDTEDEAKRSVEWYLKNSKKYKNPSYKKSNCDKYYIIYNQNPPKILKSINFKKPEINNILKKYYNQ